MKPCRLTLAIAAILISVLPALGRRVVVDPNGRGDYSNIQAAIDSIPPDNRERQVIFIRNGTYSEQLRINNSFVTLRGEDRKKTRIVASVNTSACQVAPGESKEEHCSVVIGDGTDLVFENLTIENLYKEDHRKGAALSLVNNSSRILLHDVDVIGSGGDTLTLSARRNRIGDGGEYYLNDVYVSGTYHIIVPRGAAYAVNCSFWCMGGTKNCLFAEGITRETDKLVIRNSVIDGPMPFGLGSYFRDAAWYFIGDTFSDKLLADGFIHREPAADYTVKWGEGRIYFADSKAPPYSWLKNNLASSPAKSASVITAEWVFPAWNPERVSGPQITQATRHAKEMNVVFNESVTVEGKPFLLLASGKHADYLRGSGSNVLVFEDSGTDRQLQIDPNGGAIFASAASLHHRDANLQLPQ